MFRVPETKRHDHAAQLDADATTPTKTPHRKAG
jgi:hypothetical protein